MLDAQTPRRADQDVGGAAIAALAVAAVTEVAYDGLVLLLAPSVLQGDVAMVRSLLVATFLVSATVTAAIAATTLPPYFGHPVAWRLPGLVALAGVVASASAIATSQSTDLSSVSLGAFAADHPAVLTGALAVGVVGGLMTLAAVDHAARVAEPSVLP